jgi:hypothetical protein
MVQVGRCEDIVLRRDIFCAKGGFVKSIFAQTTTTTTTLRGGTVVERAN